MSELPSMIDLGVDVAEAPAPELLPAGEYVAEVRAAEPRVSSNGNAYVAVQFYLSPEEYPVDFDVAEAPDGTILTYNRVPWPTNGSADKRGVYRLRKFMEAIGAPFEGSRVDLDKWIGCRAVIKVKHETYEGEARAVCAGVSREI
jgi:hypothetical protein